MITFGRGFRSSLALALPGLSALIVVNACATTQSAPSPPEGPGRTSATTIVRETSFEDSELAAGGRGRLELLVHSTDRPTQVLPQAYALLRRPGRDSLWRSTDEHGLARFDSLPIGEYELVVRRIGYGSARAQVQIKPGCRTDGEVYISVSAIGISPGPPPPGRVVITTCR